MVALILSECFIGILTFVEGFPSPRSYGLSRFGRFILKKRRTYLELGVAILTLDMYVPGIYYS